MEKIGDDLRILVAPLVDEFDYQDQDKVAIWKNVMQTLVSILKSWTGIFYLNAYGVFQSIVFALSLNSSALHVFFLNKISKKKCKKINKKNE